MPADTVVSWSLVAPIPSIFGFTLRTLGLLSFSLLAIPGGLIVNFGMNCLQRVTRTACSALSFAKMP